MQLSKLKGKTFKVFTSNEREFNAIKEIAASMGYNNKDTTNYRSIANAPFPGIVFTHNGMIVSSNAANCDRYQYSIPAEMMISCSVLEDSKSEVLLGAHIMD